MTQQTFRKHIFFCLFNIKIHLRSRSPNRNAVCLLFAFCVGSRGYIITIARFTKFVVSIFLNYKGNSKSPITRRTSFKSLCFVAPDVIFPPTIGLKLNQLSAELFFSIVNSHLILFIRKRLFQVAGNTFPLNYLDAISSLCTPKVYWRDMLLNIKLRH